MVSNHSILVAVYVFSYSYSWLGHISDQWDVTWLEFMNRKGNDHDPFSSGFYACGSRSVNKHGWFAVHFSYCSYSGSYLGYSCCFYNRQYADSVAHDWFSVSGWCYWYLWAFALKELILFGQSVRIATLCYFKNYGFFRFFEFV